MSTRLLFLIAFQPAILDLFFPNQAVCDVDKQSDIVVCIAVDCSPSMSDDAEEVRRTWHLVTDALKSSLPEAKIAVMNFGTTWEEAFRGRAKEVPRNLAFRIRDGSGSALGEAVEGLLTMKRKLNPSHQHKVIALIISDFWYPHRPNHTMTLARLGSFDAVYLRVIGDAPHRVTHLFHGRNSWVVSDSEEMAAVLRALRSQEEDHTAPPPVLGALLILAASIILAAAVTLILRRQRQGRYEMGRTDAVSRPVGEPMSSDRTGLSDPSNGRCHFNDTASANPLVGHPADPTVILGGTGELLEKKPRGEKRVDSYGSGAEGSQILLELFHNGVGRSRTLDFDYVSTENLGGRSVYRRGDVGRPKVVALSEIVKAYHPEAEIDYRIDSIYNMSDTELLAWDDGADAVVCAIDDPVAVKRLNGLLYSRVPCVYPGVHRGGNSGHVIYTLPGLTPCFMCSMEIDDPSALEQLHGEAALNVDIQRVAHEAVRIVLSILWSDQPSSPLHRALWPKTGNFLFIDNRANHGEGLIWLGTESRPGCEVCGQSSHAKQRRR